MSFCVPWYKRTSPYFGWFFIAAKFSICASFLIFLFFLIHCFPRCVDGQPALWAEGKEFRPATEGSLGDLPPYMDGTQLCLLRLGTWICLMNLWSQYQEISKHTFVYIVNVSLCVFVLDWMAVGVGGIKTSVITPYFASGYQLQIAFWLGVRPHVPFCSVLGPCLAWSCTGLIHAAIVSMSSYMDYSYCIWKTPCSWSHLSPLVLCNLSVSSSM